MSIHEQKNLFNVIQEAIFFKIIKTTLKMKLLEIKQNR